MSKYIHGERQKAAIIQAGIDLWHEGGAGAVTARAIGLKVGRSHAGVLFHFPAGVDDLKWQIKCEAISRGDAKIIPQLITAGDPVVAHFTTEQRTAWLNAAAG